MYVYVFGAVYVYVFGAVYVDVDLDVEDVDLDVEDVDLDVEDEEEVLFASTYETTKIATSIVSSFSR